MVCGKQRSIYVFYDGCNTWINSFLFYLSALLGLSIGPASRYLDRQVLPRVIILALLPLESLPFFSGFWPYAKVYLMLFALFAPRNILPVDSRCSTPKSVAGGDCEGSLVTSDLSLSMLVDDVKVMASGT